MYNSYNVMYMVAEEQRRFLGKAAGGPGILAPINGGAGGEGRPPVLPVLVPLVFGTSMYSDLRPLVFLHV